jgi:hypothetical protein
MHAIDKNNYGKSYLSYSAPEMTNGNETIHPTFTSKNFSVLIYLLSVMFYM